jgi:hypothetical protein
MKIPLDLSTTPDEILPVPSGMYDFEILSASVESNKAGDGQVLAIQGQIVTEGENHGRRLSERIACKGQYGPVKQKKLVMACGIEPTADTDADDLVGNIVRVKVVDSTYQDNVTGETKTASNIAEYHLVLD